MDALQALHTRNSAPRLTGKVPKESLTEIIKAGLRAPDHAQLRPWRFLVIEGEGRDRLGELFVRAKRAKSDDETEDSLKKIRAKPSRAPLIIVVAARVTPHPKVPEIEQILSAGAAAQNMMLACHALGLGAIWRTGSMAYDGLVRDGLGLLETDSIVGFLYIGEIDGRVKHLPEHDAATFVNRWGMS